MSVPFLYVAVPVPRINASYEVERSGFCIWREFERRSPRFHIQIAEDIFNRIHHIRSFQCITHTTISVCSGETNSLIRLMKFNAGLIIGIGCHCASPGWVLSLYSFSRIAFHSLDTPLLY